MGVRRLRDLLVRPLRGSALAQRWHARVRRSLYERRVARCLGDRSGRAERFPSGIVYEATMRCNLKCGFCYVGDLLNREGEWRQELSVEALERALPAKAGLGISLTGGEVLIRKDILQVLDLCRQKGYACGYLTTNGTAVDEHRAEALVALAARGFLRHISVSIDGPDRLHDAARGIDGAFDRAAAGLRRLQITAHRVGTTLRLGINTTVTRENLDSLEQMADVAAELGVDAVGLNHLMFATPAEVEQTLTILGQRDPTLVATYVTPAPGLVPAAVAAKVAALRARCRERRIRFDARPRIHASLVESYYTPGVPLLGRCVYPFLHARVGFSGRVYFCPFIRIEVGDLTTSSLEEIWNGPRYIELRRLLLDRGLFPVCRRCCKVELSRERVPFVVPLEERRVIPLTPVPR